MVLLVVLVVAVVAAILIVRSSAASGRSGNRPALRPPRVRRRPTAGRNRPVAPDDDPEFLRELERRARREDDTGKA